MNKHDQMFAMMFAIMDSLAGNGTPHLAKTIIKTHYELSDTEADAVHGAWVKYKKEQFFHDHKQFLSSDLVQEFFKGGADT